MPRRLLLGQHSGLLLLCLSASLFGFRPPPCIFVGLRLSLFRVAFGGFGICFGFGLGFCGGAPGGFLAFRFFLAQGQHARIFGHLRRAPGCGADGRAPCLRW